MMSLGSSRVRVALTPGECWSTVRSIHRWRPRRSSCNSERYQATLDTGQIVQIYEAAALTKWKPFEKAYGDRRSGC